MEFSWNGTRSRCALALPVCPSPLSVLGKGLIFGIVAGGVFVMAFIKPSFLSRDDGFLFCVNGFLLSQE
jgi:hypothetical protein